MKYFVTFIDCYTCMNWVYLLRYKDEVFQCFQNFCAYVNTHFKVQVQVLRTDNGTEYVNKRFGGFLSEKGIMHKISCPDTPPQNGVAERKNRHILEVTRSLVYTMNVPNFLWSEVFLTAIFLINRMPSRIITARNVLTCDPPYWSLEGHCVSCMTTVWPKSIGHQLSVTDGPQ
jgi:hypothetical protein